MGVADAKGYREIIMTGEMNLGKLLAEMAPTLQDGRFVFVTLENGRYGDYPYLSPIASFSEPEGLTLVIPQTAADQAGLVYDATFNCITLLVHSSLEAVGLTAAVAAKLTEHGISANVIAAYYHDHVFVPADKTEAALAALHDLTGQ